MMFAKSYWIMSSSFSTLAKVATLFFSRYKCPGPPWGKILELLYSSERHLLHSVCYCKLPLKPIFFPSLTTKLRRNKWSIILKWKNSDHRVASLITKRLIYIILNIFNQGGRTCVTLFNSTANESSKWVGSKGTEALEGKTGAQDHPEERAIINHPSSRSTSSFIKSTEPLKCSEN